MPKHLMRLFIVALVALVVPLQGMASIAAAQCMALGHHQDSPQDQAHSHDGADAHHAGGHDEGSRNDGNSSHCGPCAACCAGSASIAAAAILPIVAAPSSTKHASFHLPPRGMPLDGLDRPPLAL